MYVRVCFSYYILNYSQDLTHAFTPCVYISLCAISGHKIRIVYRKGNKEQPEKLASLQCFWQLSTIRLLLFVSMCIQMHLTSIC